MRCPRCNGEVLLPEPPVRTSNDTAADRTPADDDATVLGPSPATTPEKVTELWKRTIANDVRPEMTLKEPTQVRAATASGSVSARLDLRSRGVADVDVDLNPPPDYELLRVLGKGGMGVVYEARQTAMDRTIALKMIRPDMARDRDGRNTFLSEAVATGDLAHPNIVPIHDLGSNEDGVPFYAMKQVVGTLWLDVIGEKSQNENLDILMRAADAVAFAHSRGVIHRDLKPENVMLGDYGEVLVMDWGLAASFTDKGKADRLSTGHLVGGTPVYMAPEMALGDADKIGPASDIYLLGAILYEIVTGHPPHVGEDAMACLRAAAENRIEQTDVKGELLDIALKAMATEPAERYPDVKALQSAIREYEEHAQSIALVHHGGAELEKAVSRRDYDLFVEAISAFKQAVQLWDANEDAEGGLRQARLAYAQCAYDRRDYDLANSQLSPEEPAHQGLRPKVRAAKQAREARRKRMRALTYGVACLAVAVIVVLTVSFIWVQKARKNETAQRKRAEEALADFKAEQAKRRADRSQSAPALVTTARRLIVDKDFEGAMAAVKAAMEFDEELGDARLVHMGLLSANRRFADAAKAAQEHLARWPEDTDAATILDVCGSAGGQEEPDDVTLSRLAPLLAEHDLPTLAAMFAASWKDKMRLWTQQLVDAWPDLADRENVLARYDDGILQLSLRAADGVSDLSPLKGVPLNGLWLKGCTGVSDLSPLRGMPLEWLNLTDCHQVSGLSPLREMRLKALEICGTSVQDLSPLAGIPLRKLDATGLEITSLEPLRGMPLRQLCLNSVKVSGFSVLAGMPLIRLAVRDTEFDDLSLVKDAPLETLDISGTQVSDISALAGKPLTSLRLSNKDQDIGPLAGLPLEFLDLGWGACRNLDAVRGMPLESLIVRGDAQTRDLTWVSGLPLETLEIVGRPTNLSPLGGMKLEELAFDPSHVTNGIDIVRNMSTIQKIGLRSSGYMPPDEFWKKYDAGEFNVVPMPR